MSEPSKTGAAPRLRLRSQGATVVEVAVLSLVFLTFVFGILEMARLLFVFNTVQEVTRRAATAAANVYPNDADAIVRLKQRAVFRNSSGELMFGAPITDNHVRLDYLRYDLAVIPPSSWPSDAARNKAICTSNPQAANCIRFVQARICTPGDSSTCKAADYQTLFPLINISVPIHRATTITPVETLGYVPGTPPPCPCS